MTVHQSPRTLWEQWGEHVERVVPASAGATQRQETRRAFYAGAQAALAALIHNVGDDPGEPMTDDEEALLEGLIGECQKFMADVKAGLA